MNVTFTNNGMKYHLLVTHNSRRDIEAIAENIQPDRSLWTDANKRKHKNGSFGVQDDPTKPVKSSRDSRHHYAKPNLADFLE